MTAEEYLISLGHKVLNKKGLLYDSTGKQIYKDKGRYYVKSNKGNRLYFKANGQFELVEKGFFEKIGDKIESFAQLVGEINPQGTNAFIPQGSQKIVELSLIASGVPVKTSDGSYKTYSKEEQNTAKKLLGILGAAAIAAPAVVEATPAVIKTAGQALTPSTWVGGFFDAFGTQAPVWLLNGVDLGASVYFANQAGKEIDKNGLNWKTGINALLSLAPFTREESAIKAFGSAFRNPALSFGSVIDDFRAARNAASSSKTNLARELNKSIKNTKFVNIPIEHVSTKGVTEGAGLNSYSSSDVGFHFSPAGSPTTYNILQATNAPFVRTGIWTYTNNTKPVFVIDRGNWRYSFNPEIYNGVNPGRTIAENTMALNLKGPNFTYVNNYEGKGARSYMTTLPSFVLLSKNVESPINKFEELITLIKPKPKVTTNESLGLMIMDGNYPLDFETLPYPGGDIISRVVPEELVKSEINPHIQHISDLYNSDFYKSRLKNAGIMNEEELNDIILKLTNNISNTKFYSVSLPNKNTNAFTRFRKGKHEVIFNRTPEEPVPLAYDIHHEVGGHASERDIPKIREFNKSLIKNWKDSLLVDYETYKETLDYMFRIYPDGTWEGRGMLAPAISQMQRQGLTGKQLLESPYAQTDPHLMNFEAAMGNEWLEKVLDKLILFTPFVYGKDNKQGLGSS